MRIKTFPCGCTFETDSNGHIIFDPDVEKLPKDCSATWDMICEGNTKGVFQLEIQGSNAQKVQPRSIDELSDLIAIIRPGCTESFIKGKNLTNHYIDRKHGREDVEYLHPALEPILAPTQGILVYQEQAMAIAKELAGFSLQEADVLRKAIGKKNVELMSKIKGEFISKAIEHGIVNEEEASEIFSWIEASQRYSFNKSHSYAYATNGYLTAYAKAHFPHEFFTSYLMHAIGKPDTFEEINELVNNARLMDIYVLPPNIKMLQKDFKLVNKSPTFGMTNVKKVGKSVYDKLISCIKENGNKNINDMTFDRFLIHYGHCIKSDSMLALILSGACDCFYLNRLEMKHIYEQYKELSKRELDWIQLNPEETLVETLHQMMIKNDWSDKKRPIFRKDRVEIIAGLIDSLENPGYNLEDSPAWRAKNEQEYLGVALTCSKVDEYDTSHANCTCKEFIDGFDSRNGIAIAAELKSIREWEIKRGESKGKKMAFITLSDSTCNLDNVVMFSEDYEKHKQKLQEKSVMLFRGMRQKEKRGFLVKNVTLLRS
jgi:DNA polymerase III alpha subunit